LRDNLKELGAFIWWIENLSSMFLVFNPSVGVKHFWVDLHGRHIFALLVQEQ
jgi:hypothetical protein